jgi:hypothetical protein
MFNIKTKLSTEQNEDTLVLIDFVSVFNSLSEIQISKVRQKSEKNIGTQNDPNTQIPNPNPDNPTLDAFDNFPVDHRYRFLLFNSHVKFDNSETKLLHCLLICAFEHWKDVPSPSNSVSLDLHRCFFHRGFSQSKVDASSLPPCQVCDPNG